MFTTVLFFAVSSLSVQAQSDDRFRDVQINAIQVADNLYMLTGQGGNIGLSVGEDGAVLIDDQFAPLSAKIKAAVAKITDKPIQFIINTHWHGDHTGGNQNFAGDGALIVAHDNVRKRMSIENTNTLSGQATPPSPDGALPVITFNESMTFHLNGEEAAVIHLPNSHTDGDSIIHFRKSNVIHTGDIFFHGAFPFIDINSKGSINGIIKSLQHIISIADDATKIIPGHGQLADKKAIEKDLQVLISARDRIQKLINEGKSLDQVKAANPVREYADSYGNGFIKTDIFIGLVYNSLKG